MMFSPLPTSCNRRYGVDVDAVHVVDDLLFLLDKTVSNEIAAERLNGDDFRLSPSISRKHAPSCYDPR